MHGKTVFITGPMLDRPGLNLDAFEEVAALVEERGGSPIHPAEVRLGLGWNLDGANDDFDLVRAVEQRTAALLGADLVLTLGDWRACPESAADVAIARVVGVPVRPAPTPPSKRASAALTSLFASTAFTLVAPLAPKALALVA